MTELFKLRECIAAHDNDVKSVFALSDGYGFISASRDLSVRLWRDEIEKFKEEKKYLFHKNFISAVIYMNPSLNYTDGLILSAGYDKIIYGFSPLSGNLEFSLTGHTNTVTSLSVNGMELVSGSMDNTAIIWNLMSNSISCVLKGHSLGIWSVALLQCIENGLLTGSADKDIFLWNTKTQKRTQTFAGHTDCVRHVVELPERKQFLSCSNDASVRLWSLMNGSCVKEFHYHSSYIYSLALMSDENTFVSCGEDGMVCVWDTSNALRPLQTLVHNAQSVWCVSVLNNGDILTGASDGRIRIFSRNPNFQNGVELLKSTKTGAIDSAMFESMASVGIEMLSLPGTYDGQPLKVMDEETLVLYSWSASKDLWIKQNVVDAPQGNSQQKKSHDYIFSIDIKDGEPPLKLPYNNGQDPYVVAHKFLEDNDLSPQFLDQVANFIISNTNSIPTVVKSENTFSDPFTGGNRYVPNMTEVVVPTKMFPHKICVKFDQINATGLSKKIVELIAPDVVPTNILSLIENISTISLQDSFKICSWTIERMSDWDTENLFPLIDILRMLVRQSPSNELCFGNADLVTKLFAKTLALGSRCPRPNILTMTKFLCNAYIHYDGQNLMNSMFDTVAEALLLSVQLHNDKNIMNAISSWFLNSALVMNEGHDDRKRLAMVEMCFQLLDFVTSKMCPEAVLRVMVTIGTLVCNKDTFSFREDLTVGIFEKINNATKMYQDRSTWGNDVVLCCEQLAQLVSSLDLFNF